MFRKRDKRQQVFMFEAEGEERDDSNRCYQIEMLVMFAAVEK